MPGRAYWSTFLVPVSYNGDADFGSKETATPLRNKTLRPRGTFARQQYSTISVDREVRG